MGAQQMTDPVRRYLAEQALPISKHIRKLATGAHSEYVQLEASNSILDRAGYAAPKLQQDNRQLTIIISGESAQRYLPQPASKVESETAS